MLKENLKQKKNPSKYTSLSNFLTVVNATETVLQVSEIATSIEISGSHVVTWSYE